jgi:hypothetical protein
MSLIPITGWGELNAAPILVCDAKMAPRYLAPLMQSSIAIDALAYSPGDGRAGQYQILAGPLVDSAVIMSQATQIVLTLAYDWEMANIVVLLIRLTNSGYQLVRLPQRLNAQSMGAKVLVGWGGRRKRHSVCYFPSTGAERNAFTTASWPNVRQIMSDLSAIAFADIEQLALANHEVRAALAEDRRRAAKRAELRERGIFLREPCFASTKKLPPMVTYVRL